MNLQVAMGAMRLVSNLGKVGFLDNAGVSKGDFDRLTGDIPWMASERNRMTTALQTLILGSVDALGLPRFPVPAEYSAAGIAIFVHPINVHAACVFLSTAPDAETLARRNESDNISKGSHVDPERLFALVVLLFDTSERNSARILFEKNTGLRLNSVEKKGAKDDRS